MVSYLEIARRVAERQDRMKKVKWDVTLLTEALRLYKRVAGRVKRPSLVTQRAMCMVVGSMVGSPWRSLENALRNHVETTAQPPHVEDDDYVLLKTWIVEGQDSPNPVPVKRRATFIHSEVADIIDFVEKKNDELEMRNKNLRDQLASVEEAFELEKKTVENLKKKVQSLKDREFEMVKEMSEQSKVEQGFMQRVNAKYGVAAVKGGK